MRKINGRSNFLQARRHCTCGAHILSLAIYWNLRGLKFVKEIGRKIQEKTGNKNATSHIIQAISMTVQRGNATSIMGTLGPLRKLEDFFDVISPREEES